MSHNKIIKVGYVYSGKREFHSTKNPVDIKNVNIDDILTSNRYLIGKNSLKHFIGYLNHSEDVITPLFLTLLELNIIKEF